jgi:hypothetical protein
MEAIEAEDPFVARGLADFRGIEFRVINARPIFKIESRGAHDDRRARTERSRPRA